MPITTEVPKLDLPLLAPQETPRQQQPKVVKDSRKEVSGILMRILPEKRKLLRLVKPSDQQGYMTYVGHSMENGDVKATVKIKLPPSEVQTFEFELTFMDMASFDYLKERMWDELYRDYVSQSGGFAEHDIKRVDEMVQDILNTFNPPEDQDQAVAVPSVSAG